MSQIHALAFAAKYGLQDEVNYCINTLGYTPEQALEEWDII